MAQRAISIGCTNGQYIQTIQCTNNARYFLFNFLLILKFDVVFFLFDAFIETISSDDLPPHLYGLTFYGENIQDEWYIVEIISHLTKIYTHVIARVCDSDGEFLLIEAADVLPKWANPDTCGQRV